jgi:hypothetical protein
MTENLGHHGHEDQPDEHLHDDHLDPDAGRHREIDEWIDEIIRRPWFSALKSLPGEVGFWVGTEGDLMEELRRRTVEVQAGDADVASEDFPSSAREIIEPPPNVDWAMRKERLSLVDYRKVEKELRGSFDAPGWGRKAPILLELGLAAHKPSHEGAQYILATKYRNPLAILVVGFTYDDPTFKRNQRMWLGNTRWWSGRTWDLATRLSEALAEKIELPGELWQIQCKIGELHEQHGQTEEAWDAFSLAAQTLRMLAGKIGDEKLREGFLSAARVRRVLSHN